MEYEYESTVWYDDRGPILPEGRGWRLVNVYGYLYQDAPVFVGTWERQAPTREQEDAVEGEK